MGEKVMVIRSRTSLACAATTVLLAASAVTASRVTAAAPASTFRPAATTEFTLITGERILETQGAGGRPEFAIASLGAAVFTYQVGAARYFIDSAAMPFVGSELDPTLFEQAASAGGAVAVVVDWHGHAAPRLPWLLEQRTIAAGVTGGLITATSGAALRSALVQEPASARGAWAGALSGVDRISSTAGATTPARQSPLFVQYTLTVDGIDGAGRPDTGDSVNILNTDSIEKFNGFAFWSRGVIKVSVPTGHYSLFGEFFAGGKTGGATLQFVIVNITVAANATVVMDARDATSAVSEATPLPTASGSGGIIWQRTDAAQAGSFAAGALWSIGGGSGTVRVYVSPTPAPKYGTQGWAVDYHLDSPASASSEYTYDLAFGSLGAIAARQRHVVTRAQLATVDTRYFSDVSDRLSAASRSGFLPWQALSVSEFDPLIAPVERTEYVLAGPDLSWGDTVVQDYTDFAGFVSDSFRQFAAGEPASEDWGRGPSGPSVAVDTGVVAPLQACPVCLEDNTLEFLIYPFGDNPPGHFGSPNEGAPGVTETDSAILERDGVTLISGTDPLGPVPVPPGPGHYVLSYSVAMSAPWWTLSTSTTTTWRFSTPRSLAGAPPAGWACFSGSSTGCSVVGLMFPDYEVPVSMLNQMASGPVSFTLGIDHVLGATIAVRQATVSVSFDGGATWHAAHVSSNGTGGFTVGYQDPPGPGAASLRIHVTDADGGVLDQTIVNAYGIS